MSSIFFPNFHVASIKQISMVRPENCHRRKGFEISLINIRIQFCLLSEKQIKSLLLCASMEICKEMRDEEKSGRAKHISITLDEGKKKKEIKSKSASKIMTDYACYLFCSLFLIAFLFILHDLCLSSEKYSGPSRRIENTVAKGFLLDPIHHLAKAEVMEGARGRFKAIAKALKDCAVRAWRLPRHVKIEQ